MSQIPLPHLYDDPRILYDDPTIFFDGNTDIIFVVPEKKKIKGGGIVGSFGKRKEVVYPKEEIINLTFKTSIESINGVSLIHDYSKISTYRFNKIFDIKITVSDLVAEIKNQSIGSGMFEVITNNLSEHISSSLHFNKPNKINIKSTIIK